MKQRSLFASRMAPTLSILTVGGLALWFPISGIAQSLDPGSSGTRDDRTAPDQNRYDPTDRNSNNGDVSPDDQNSTDTTSTDPKTTNKKRKPPKPRPANPLVIPDAPDPNSAKLDPKNKAPEFKDHTRPDPKAVNKNKQLPLFGYEFFKPARDIIEAHRRYIRTRYNIDASGSQNTGGPNSLRNGLRRNGSSTGPRALYDSYTGKRIVQRNSANGDGSDASGDPRTLQQADDGYNPDYVTPTHRRRTLPSDDTSGQTGTSDQTDSMDQTDTSDPSDQTDPTMRSNRSNRSQSNDTSNQGDDSSASDGSLYPNDSNSDPIYGSTGDTGSRPRRQTNQRIQNSNARYNSGNSQDNGYSNSQDNNFSNPRYSQAPDQPIPSGDPLDMLIRGELVTAPSDYHLAPGDVLTISYSSPTMEPVEIKRPISSDGTVTIENVGPVVVRGLTTDAASTALTAKLRRFFKNVEVSVTMGKLRSIPVQVLGNAFQPGTYQVPAVTTAYNLLYYAGGPTEKGTLRNIIVRRQGKVVATLDIYKFQVLGTEVSDVVLQPGDQLIVGPTLARITLKGEVLTPAIYELRNDETLQDAMKFSGGIKRSGVDNRIQVNTLVPGRMRVLTDVDLKSNKTEKLALYDGDVVEVFPVRTVVTNKVTVEGAVDQPGDYELTTGMKVSDLLEKARNPIAEADLSRADLYKWNPDNTTTLVQIDLQKAMAHDATADIVLNKWDRLKLYTRDEVAWTGYRRVTVAGSIQHPGIYRSSKNMHVSDLLRMVGGPTPDASLDHAFLLHQHGDGTSGLEYFNVAQAIQGDKTQDIAIQDNDMMTIYSVNQASYQPEHTISIQGEVVNPGKYPRPDGMKVEDLLNMAGGFRPDAGSKVVIAHARKIIGGANAASQTVSIAFDSQGKCAPNDNVPLEDGDVVLVQGTGGFSDKAQTITIKGAVNHPGPITLANKNMRLTDALKAAGGLGPEAFPQGAEFLRDPKLLTTDQQQNLAQVMNDLNQLLNEKDFKRTQAKEKLDIITESNKAQNSSGGIGIPGIGGAPAAQSSAAGVAGAQLGTQTLASPARTLDKELQADGNISVDLVQAIRRPGGPNDIILKDGDVITIPETPTTVQVVGAVFHPTAVAFVQGANLDYYVARSGGFAPDAGTDRIEIIHAGGGALPATKVKTFEPGDVIFIPTKVLAAKLNSGHSNPLGTFFNSIVSGALLIKLFGL